MLVISKGGHQLGVTVYTKPFFMNNSAEGCLKPGRTLKSAKSWPTILGMKYLVG